MAVPYLINIEEYLISISEDKPSGENLRWEAEYDQIEAARTPREETESQGSSGRERKPSGWDEVISLGTKVLREKSKDLRIAGFVAEALAQRHGLAGLRDGIRLLHALQEQFWDTAHPEPEDGNFELREGIYEWLDGNRHLPLIVRSVPVTAGIGDLRYSFFRYQELRDIENLYLEDPDRVEALRAEGKIRAHNCPAINRLNVDGWESPSLSIAIFRQEILSFPQVFCQPTWYLT